MKDESRWESVCGAEGQWECRSDLVVVVGVNKLLCLCIYKRQAGSKTEATVDEGGEAPKVEKRWPRPDGSQKDRCSRVG